MNFTFKCVLRKVVFCQAHYDITSCNSTQNVACEREPGLDVPWVRRQSLRKREFIFKVTFSLPSPSSMPKLPNVREQRLFRDKIYPEFCLRFPKLWTDRFAHVNGTTVACPGPGIRLVVTAQKEKYPRGGVEGRKEGTFSCAE